MLENIEALRELAASGTMVEAATRLRLTQSAVSKRIGALESATGLTLIERDGRRVRLTPSGLNLLKRTEGPMAEIRAALAEPESAQARRVEIAVSESVLGSWGARALALARAEHPELELILHSHRSLTAIDRVRSGECQLAICAGVADSSPDLRAEPILEEPLVIVPNLLDRSSLKLSGVVPVMTIEARSATWTILGQRLRRVPWRDRLELKVVLQLESFQCLVQMARAGFGHALVPAGIAKAMGVNENRWIALPAPGLKRPVSWVGRPSIFGSAWVQKLMKSVANAPQFF